MICTVSKVLSPALARRSPLIFIFITVFIDLMGYGMVIPLLPFFVQRQAAGATAAGALGSLYALMQLIAGPILGALSDRYGRRPVLLLCLLGTATGYLILGLADSLPLIFIAIMIDGITGGNLSTAYAYIADVTTKENRARGMGLVGAAFGLGLMAGPAIGGLLSAYGLSTPAFFACVLTLSNVVFGFFVLPESLPPEKRMPIERWRALNWLTQLSVVFRLATIRWLLLATFALNLAFAGLQTNFPLFSQARFGWDATRNGIFFAFVGVCAVVVQGILYGWLQPRVGEKRLAIIGLILMALSLAAVAIAPTDGLMYPIVALGALGSGTSIPSITGLISQRVSSGEQGRLMGGTQVVLNLALIFGPIIAGLSFERVDIAAPYWLGSMFAVSALICAWVDLYAHK
jgi:DHA1 family tetracycline resistance protein-like MFS transporter